MNKAIDVAKYIISLNQNEDKPKDLTNLKLQKLLYYCFGVHQLKYNENLFNDKILAWRLGPVIREVYDNYKTYGYSIITEEYDVSNIQMLKHQVATIIEVWDAFKDVPASVLVDMTHSETPWKVAWGNQLSEISKNSIKEYFQHHYAG